MREGGIYTVFANVRNPLVIDYAGHLWNNSPSGKDINYDASYAMLNNYDGVIAKNIRDVGSTELDAKDIPPSTDVIVFNSNNRGCSSRNWKSKRNGERINNRDNS